MVSMVLSNFKSNNEGDTTLKNKLMVSAIIVAVTTEKPVCLLENKVQIIGANSAPPAMDAVLNTTSTIPPALGIQMATQMVKIPNNSVKKRAIKITSFSEAFLRIRFL